MALEERMLFMRSKATKSQLNYQLFLNIILLLLGIVLLIFPNNGLAFFTWVVGIALCGTGIVCGVIFAINRKSPSISLIIVAVATIILGILTMVFRVQVALFILPFIIGLGVVASAVVCIMAALGYRKTGAAIWWLPLITALIAVIVAFLIFANLSGTARFLAYVIATYLIVFSALRIGEYVTLHKYVK